MPFTADQLKTLRGIVPQGVSDNEFNYFVAACERTGLDPFARQIYMSERSEKRGNDYFKTYRPETTIDGFRIIAQRTGKYGGQLGPHWCGKDGKWVEVWLSPDPPAAARVGIIRSDFREPLYAVALYSEYAQTNRDGGPNMMWKKMPANQLAKCFDDQTEVFTDHGFVKFSDVGPGVLVGAVRGGEIDFVQARPFCQSYSGPMVTADNDMVDFSVTPNHDMVTTFGRVEAGALLATATTNGPWEIPMRTSPAETPVAVDRGATLRLHGYIAADGWHGPNRRWLVSVSRPHKIASLRAVGADHEGVAHAKGNVATAGGGREIRSNFDKAVFSFQDARIQGLTRDKTWDIGWIRTLTPTEAKIVIDAWIEFDGNTNKKTGVRRLYTSRVDHLRAAELLAVIAGYSVNTPRSRTSDISATPNYSMTISAPRPMPIRKVGRHTGSTVRASAYDGLVWCVTVPGNTLIVRRRGFSMICGNCAESGGLRKAFPNDLSGLYTHEEMGQASNPEPEPERPLPQRASDTHPTPPVAPAPAAPAPANAPNAIQVSCVIANVSSRSGKTNGRDWTIFEFTSEGGEVYKTFNKDIAAAAEILKGKHVKLVLESTKTAGGQQRTTVIDILHEGEDAGPEDGGDDGQMELS